MARAKNTTARATTRTSSAKRGPQPPSIRGEKRVSKTDATVPVGPARRKRGTHDGPTAPAAIDRRRQITGTDELGNENVAGTRRKKGGGAPLT